MAGGLRHAQRGLPAPHCRVHFPVDLLLARLDAPSLFSIRRGPVVNFVVLAIAIAIDNVRVACPRPLRALHARAFRDVAQIDDARTHRGVEFAAFSKLSFRASMGAGVVFLTHCHCAGYSCFVLLLFFSVRVTRASTNFTARERAHASTNFTARGSHALATHVRRDGARHVELFQG